MSTRRQSDTIVIQTFRNHDVPPWIVRCLDSVQKWAEFHGHDYSLAGDEFYDLCGPEYLARGSKNPQAITNLARLVATRQRLDAGYERVIWMDADIFVFDPVRLVFDFSAGSLPLGYALGREVFLIRNPAGLISFLGPTVHNAAMFFTQRAVDLDMLITLIRHIDAGRQIAHNFQVGVNLLRGLQYSLMFPTFSHVGVFSPLLLRALAESDEELLRFYGRSYRYHVCAANLGLSQRNEIKENIIRRAMDYLEVGAGNAVNKYATETGVHLVPYDYEQPATFTSVWSSRLKAILRSRLIRN